MVRCCQETEVGKRETGSINHYSAHFHTDWNNPNISFILNERASRFHLLQHRTSTYMKHTQSCVSNSKFQKPSHTNSFFFSCHLTPTNHSCLQIRPNSVYYSASNLFFCHLVTLEKCFTFTQHLPNNAL